MLQDSGRVNFDIQSTTLVRWGVFVSCVTDVWFGSSSVHRVSYRDISIVILLTVDLLGFDFKNLGGIFTFLVCMSSTAVGTRLCTFYTICILLGWIHVMMMRLLFRLYLRQICWSTLGVLFIFKHILIVIIIFLMRTIVLCHRHTKVALEGLAFCWLRMWSCDLIIVSWRSVYCIDYLWQQSTHFFISHHCRHSLGDRISTMISWIDICDLAGPWNSTEWLIWDSLELYCIIGGRRQLELE